MNLVLASITDIGAVVGDHARAAMLLALMDGRAYTASELARVAAITPQTASAHLRRLCDAGLVAVQAQGRHRYHRLASGQVADMLEGIMRVAGQGRPRPRPVRRGPRDAAMRRARTCYRHLAGELAVAITAHLLAAGYLDARPDGWHLAPAGAAFLGSLSRPLAGALERHGEVPAARFCRGCLDWSERRPHVAGVIGEAMLQGFLEDRWLRRTDGSRALAITTEGRLRLREHFSIDA